MSHLARISKPPHLGSPLPWWLAGLAAVAIMSISVSAWNGADAQQLAAEAAVVKFATTLAEAKAREFSQAIDSELAFSPIIKLTWFSVPGEPEDWIFGPWPQPESDQWTASGLPKETLQERLTFESTKSPEAARELAASALQHPSALTAAFLEEAGTVLPEYIAQAARFSSLRSVLRQQKEDVVHGKPWLGKSHYAVPNQASGLLQVISTETISAIKQRLSSASMGLPLHWRFQLSLPGEESFPCITQSTHQAATVGIISSDPAADFAAERATLLRTRWLIVGATGFMLAALAGFVGVIYKQRKLNRMMSNFVASVSHELRAPVASMGLLAERLGEGKVTSPAELLQYHKLLGGEAKRITATIENVLAFSRMERGKLKHEAEASDLTALLHDAVSIARLLAQSRHIQVLEDFPETVIELELDPISLRQAILNLLDNALKFSPPEGKIFIKLRQTEIHTIISIRDQGPGIPTHERERIFQPFYRIGSELRRETPGIGIGLALVKETALAHGGHVMVQNPLDATEGAEFVLTLPTI